MYITITGRASKHRLLGPNSSVSDSVGLGVGGPKICIFNKPEVMPKLLVQVLHFENHRAVP